MPAVDVRAHMAGSAGKVPGDLTNQAHHVSQRPASNHGAALRGPGPTSGIEHISNLHTRSKGEQWRTTELVEERLLVLTRRAHHSPALPPRLLRAARAVRARNFGNPRIRVRESFGARGDFAAEEQCGQAQVNRRGVVGPPAGAGCG